MTRKRLQPYMKALEDLGVQLITFEINKHVRLHVECQGKKHFFIVPISGSDCCGVLNFKQDVRRWMRNL